MSPVPESTLTIAHVLSPRRLVAVERQVFDLAAAQAVAGHQVHIINLAGPQPVAALPAGVSHRALNLPCFRVAQLNLVLRQLRAQVCHGHGAFACRIVAHSGSAIRVGTLHTGYEHHRHHTLDGLISASTALLPPPGAYQGASQVIQDWIPLSLRPPESQPWNSDARRRRSLRRALGLPQDRVLVGAWVQRQHDPGIDKLVEAFRRYGPGHAVLVVIGDRRCKRWFSRRVNGQPGIHFIEADESSSDIFPDLDLLACVSEDDGPATTLLMAMQCGLPILAVDAPRIRQLLQSSPATLVTGEGPDELGIAMQACLRGLRHPYIWSPPTRLRYDLSCHDRTTAVASIESFYRRLLARKACADVACTADTADIADSAPQALGRERF